MKINYQEILLKVLRRKTAICYFAITHNCNARCKSCSMWSIKPEEFLDISKIKKAIDKLDKIGVVYIQITGGEPLLYPEIVQVIKYIKSKGIITHIVTNGSLLNEEKTKKISEAGIDGVALSVDHFDKEILNEERGIDNLSEKIENGIKLLKRFNIDFQASVTITKKNYKDLDKLCMVLKQMGFEMISFCYPITSTGSSFKIGSDDPSIRFNKDENIDILNEIISLKKKYNIFNSLYSLHNLKDYLKGNKVKYNCVAGHKMFYLDWNLVLHRCIMKNEDFGNILDTGKLDLKRRECNDCLAQCFRDPSIYYHGFNSIKPLIELFRLNVMKKQPAAYCKFF